MTRGAVLDALEATYPRGTIVTIRDRVTRELRPFLSFCACAQDLTPEPADAPLPDAVAHRAEPFLVVGAMAGG